jgi:hypothetical protein
VAAAAVLLVHIQRGLLDLVEVEQEPIVVQPEALGLII